MEIEPEPVALARLTRRRSSSIFQPVAEKEDSGVRDRDRRRTPADDRDRPATARTGPEEPPLERVQVHRAGQGGAARSGAPATARSRFAVTDTGIGIPEDQQKACSRPSGRRTARSAANTAAPASACRSRRELVAAARRSDRAREARQGAGQHIHRRSSLETSAQRARGRGARAWPRHRGRMPRCAAAACSGARGPSSAGRAGSRTIANGSPARGACSWSSRTMRASPHPQGPVPRDGVRVPGRRTARPRRWRWPSEFTAERGRAGRRPARPFGALGARPAQARRPHPAYPGSRGVGRRQCANGAFARRRRLHAEARQARANWPTF